MSTWQIRIESLVPGDAEALSELLTCEPEYSQYFTPFASSEPGALATILSNADRDQYWCFRCGEVMGGLLMLRGFDEGYAIPALGLYIAQEYSGKGLGLLAVSYALVWCRLNAIGTVMLKVHASNTRARSLYEGLGFEYKYLCPQSGQRVYEKHLA